MFVDYLNDAQKKAYILADNRMAMDAGWDEELLRVEIESLQGADFDGARIREFDTSLTAMHTLQKSLSESLQVQWQMEQQRADRMTRLAHELKKPLAII